MAIIDVVRGTELADQVGPMAFVKWLVKLRDYCTKRIAEGVPNSSRFLWALDGGVFLAEEGTQNVNKIHEHMVRVCFDLLKDVPIAAPQPYGNHSFSLRMSIGQAAICYQKKISGPFEVAYGKDLSVLMKYERLLGRPNELTITEPVKQWLSSDFLARNDFAPVKAKRKGWQGPCPYAIPIPRQPDLDDLAKAHGAYADNLSFSGEMAKAQEAEKKIQFLKAHSHYTAARAIDPTSIEAWEGEVRMQRQLEKLDPT